MSFPLNHYLFFFLSFIAAIAMIVEGCAIVVLKKQITPLPTRILFRLGVLVVGHEKSTQQFSGKASDKNLDTYATVVLTFGTIILISSVVYLFTTIL